MKKLAIVSTIFFTACSLSYAATLHSLNKDDTMKTFEGKTITTVPLVTMNRKLVSDNPVSVYFAKDGTMKGRFANKPDDFSQTDEGTWKVKSSGEFCVTWKSWEEAKELCVNSYKLDNSVVFINTKNDFESMVLEENIKDGDQV